MGQAEPTKANRRDTDQEKNDLYSILVFYEQTYFSLKDFLIFLSFFHFLEV
jgi:hypothetical protein